MAPQDSGGDVASLDMAAWAAVADAVVNKASGGRGLAGAVAADEITGY